MPAPRPNVVLLAALGLLALGAPVRAEDLVSPSYRLHAGTVVGGGAVALTSSAAGGSVGTAGATAGEASLVGIATSSGGLRLESGFWRVAPIPEPAVGSSTLAAVAALTHLARRRRGNSRWLSRTSRELS